MEQHAVEYPPHRAKDGDEIAAILDRMYPKPKVWIPGPDCFSNDVKLCPVCLTKLYRAMSKIGGLDLRQRLTRLAGLFHWLSMDIPQFKGEISSIRAQLNSMNPTPVNFTSLVEEGIKIMQLEEDKAEQLTDEALLKSAAVEYGEDHETKTEESKESDSLDQYLDEIAAQDEMIRRNATLKNEFGNGKFEGEEL
eukprot:CAMPEP_0184504916 /NCGR_PEP_ID=MMETSP0113_2-20130426/52711_1 /TAXON_ID=91329 /ORGANISM="Norrisiella sphaerica, Strain BC52" /LENGTH=193 /DNA_ID=CAMNT_0026894579 /DNA_START=1847 /DNA_END=2428 /DNA_ORIENTATION=+